MSAAGRSDCRRNRVRPIEAVAGVPMGSHTARIAPGWSSAVVKSLTPSMGSLSGSGSSSTIGTRCLPRRFVRRSRRAVETVPLPPKSPNLHSFAERGLLKYYERSAA